MQGQYSLRMREASISASTRDLRSELSRAMSASMRERRTASSAATREAASSASTLDLRTALSAAIRSASISAATRDLRRAASVSSRDAANSAASLDLLRALSVAARSAATSTSMRERLSAASVATCASNRDRLRAASAAMREEAISASTRERRSALSASRAARQLDREGTTGSSRGSRTFTKIYCEDQLGFILFPIHPPPTPTHTHSPHPISSYTPFISIRMADQTPNLVFRINNMTTTNNHANSQQHFQKKVLDGDKGRVMLQISKTFRGDSRFQLDDRFEKDVDIEQMPDKFKQTLENDLLKRVQEKTKQIRKEQPTLIIRRFEPGTASAEKIVRRAEGKKNFVESVFKAEKKKMAKAHVEKGVDKVAKANRLLQQGEQKPMPKFKLQVKGDKKEAFQPSHFKLFE